MYPLLALVSLNAALVLAACADGDRATREAALGTASPSVELNAPAVPLSSSTPLMLFDFDGADAARWTVENDGVMGGRSKGRVEIADGVLVFTGTVVTEGGGFTSIRAPVRAELEGYQGLELRVRGGGRTFELSVEDGTRSRGRQVNRRGPFPTSDAWATVRVPFASLKASAHGESVRVDPLDRSAVESVAIYIIDGQDGPFRLEVDWIRAYREAE